MMDGLLIDAGLRRERVRQLNEVSVPGRRGWKLGVAPGAPIGREEGTDFLESAAGDCALFADRPPALPELSELDVVRHFTRLSTLNYSVDHGFYPLGSCTMKYNPRINESVAALEGFTELHPLTDPEDCQGLLELFFELETRLSLLLGYHRFSLQPAAGAQGEFVGLLVIRAYHEDRDDHGRREILIPDSAHGTNPASAAAAGFDVVVLPSDEDGRLRARTVRQAVGPRTAGLMLTNPNTLGLFEHEVQEIAAVVHEAGGLVYYDGANANAIIGRVRPGDMGFDVCHLNLHKTFSAPHGGGGPGAGPVGVRAGLEDFLPGPVVVRRSDGSFAWEEPPQSAGSVHAWYGNSLVLLKALAYIRTLGGTGCREASGMAVLNANYVLRSLDDLWEPAKPGPVMHEAVLNGKPLRDSTGLGTLDVAKRLIDYGFHPPTMYFPLIVPEALMIEPTETESRETLDRFIAAMRRIHTEMHEEPDLLREAPRHAVVGRPDEVQAARRPILTWMQQEKDAAES